MDTVKMQDAAIRSMCKVATAIDAAFPPDLAMKAYALQGDLLLRAERFEESLVMFEMAINLFRTQNCGRFIDLATWLTAASVGECYMGLSERAAASLAEAMSVWEIVLGSSNPALAVYLESAGNMEVAERHFDQALKYYLKALSIQRKAHGENHGAVGVVAKKLAAVYRELGRPKDAALYSTMAKRVREQTSSQN